MKFRAIKFPKFKRRKYSEDEYRYAAARVSAMSASLISDETIDAFCELKSPEELRERLTEAGICSQDGEGFEYELSLYLLKQYETLASFLPDSELCSVMRARFDCHNVKTAIKCAFIGISPNPYYMAGGEIETDAITEAAQKHGFELLPPIIREAAEKADEAIHSNSPARTVDVLLDNACFEYMTQKADALGCKDVVSLLALKADITNMLTRLRILGIKNEETRKALLDDSFVTGGKIKTDVLSAAESTEDVCALFESVLDAESKKLLSDAETLGNDAISRVCDVIFRKEAEKICKFRNLDIYPVIDYIIRVEYEVKNLRIIACGLESGKTADKIREELRL